MKLGRYASLAAMLVAGIATAGEPRRMPPGDALRDVRLIEPSGGASPTASPPTTWTRSAKPPGAPGAAFRGTQHPTPSRAAPVRVAQVPTGQPGKAMPQTEPAKPPEDLFQPPESPPETPPAKPPEEMPQTQPPAETPEAQPPAEAPGEQPPTAPPERFFEPAPPGEMPREEPRRAPPPRARPEEMPAPTPAPPRPRGAAPRAAPPRTEAPPPQQYPAEAAPGEGGEWFEDGSYADACESSCYEDDSCGAFYDHYCPSAWPVLPPIPPGTWVNLDYLMWWGRGQSLPGLVTVGGTTGAIGEPGAAVVFGDKRVDTDIRSGGRLTVGTWLDPERTVGLVGSFLDMQRAATNFRANSDGDPILARPYFNTLTQAQDSVVIAQTDVSRGAVEARTTANFLAADGYFRHAMLSGTRRRVDFTWGYRWLEVEDSIRVNDREVITDGGGIIPLGTVITGRDEFRAANYFNGAQIGIYTDRIAGRLSWNTLWRISLGNMRQTVQIEGDTTVTEPDIAPVTTSGNVLAQPSNIGNYHRDVFAVVPELNMNLGYQVTPRLRATVGYTFIFIDRVAQAGRQIDKSVDPSQFGGGPPGTAPLFRFQQNGFWMQGINFGVNMRF